MRWREVEQSGETESQKGDRGMEKTQNKGCGSGERELITVIKGKVFQAYFNTIRMLKELSAHVIIHCSSPYVSEVISF